MVTQNQKAIARVREAIALSAFGQLIRKRILWELENLVPKMVSLAARVA